MAIDPSKISLKGLYLDFGSSVGGSRNVYNNGVMCAKFYVGFSYGGTDESTVRDIIQWLLENAELRTCAGNHTDNGIPSDYGWKDYGNSDPNHEKFVYDTQVVVPVNNEDWDQQPGNSIWHYSYFVQPNESNLNPINVYLKYTYTGASGNEITVSTLNDNLLTITTSIWNFLDIDYFRLYKEKDLYMACVSYNPETVPDYNSNIHYVCGWNGTEIYPSTDTTSFSGLSDLYELPFDASSDYTDEITYNRYFYIVACDYGERSITALVDNNDPIKFNDEDHIIHQNGRCVCKPSAVTIAWVTYLKARTMDTRSPLSPALKSGAVIAHWVGGDARIEQFYNDSTYGEHLDVFEKDTATVTAPAVDSFGNRFRAKMTFGDGSQLISDWELLDITEA